MRLLLHVGFPKCASTALQRALANSASVLYPQTGWLEDEHLSIPLHLKGLDSWTAQFFDETWVNAANKRILGQIKGAQRTVAVSSERLIDLSEAQMLACRELFSDFEVEIVILRRSVEKYVESSWRHAVFHHDLAMPFEEYQASLADLSIDSIIAKFRAFFPVHEIDLEGSDYIVQLRAVFGQDLTLTMDNVGISLEAARFLQAIHARVGEEKFRTFFTPERKKDFAAAFSGPAGAVATLNAPIMMK